LKLDDIWSQELAAALTNPICFSQFCLVLFVVGKINLSLVMEDEREEEKLASPYSHPMVAHVAQQNVTLDVNNLIRELELVKRNLWTN